MAKKSSSSSAATTTNQTDSRQVLGENSAQVGDFGTYMRDSGNLWNSNNTNTTNFDVYDSSKHDSSQHWTDNTQNSTSFQVNDDSTHDLSQHWTDNTQWTDSRDQSDRSTTSNSTSFQVNDSSSRDSSVKDSRSYADSRSYDSSDRSNTTLNYTGVDGGAIEMSKFNAALLQSLSEDQNETVRLISQMGADGISKQAAAATDLFATGSHEAGQAWGHTLDVAGDTIDKLLSSAQATITGAQTVSRDALSANQSGDSKSADTLKYAVWGAAALGALFILKA